MTKSRKIAAKDEVPLHKTPAAQTLVARKSSITNAFVNAILPIFPPTRDDYLRVLSLLEMDPNNPRCAYCGDASTEWDHLRPLVQKQRPTGYVTEIANLVPACNKCNQSKQNKNWREWIVGTHPRSPASRGIAELQRRIQLLDKLEQELPPRLIDFQAIVGDEMWDTYWALWANMFAELERCQAIAKDMLIRIRAGLESVSTSQAEVKEQSR